MYIIVHYYVNDESKNEVWRSDWAMDPQIRASEPGPQLLHRLRGPLRRVPHKARRVDRALITYMYTYASRFYHMLPFFSSQFDVLSPRSSVVAAVEFVVASQIARVAVAKQRIEEEMGPG